MYENPDAYVKTIRRNVTRKDTVVQGPSGEYTVRRFYEDGQFLRADVYLGGRWMGGYKTEAGITKRVAR